MDSNSSLLKEEALYLPCILRRLTDLEPQIQKEPYAAGVFTAKQLKRDIFENIETILNSRSHTLRKDLEKYDGLNSSVLGYGLPDFCGKICTQEGREEIRDIILQQILHFEPRLAPTSVAVDFLQDEPTYGSTLEFQISGYIQVGQLSEEVVFISKLDLETGCSTVQTARS